MIDLQAIPPAEPFGVVGLYNVASCVLSLSQALEEHKHATEGFHTAAKPVYAKVGTCNSVEKAY